MPFTSPPNGNEYARKNKLAIRATQAKIAAHRAQMHADAHKMPFKMARFEQVGPRVLSGQRRSQKDIQTNEQMQKMQNCDWENAANNANVYQTTKHHTKHMNYEEDENGEENIFELQKSALKQYEPRHAVHTSETSSTMEFETEQVHPNYVKQNINMMRMNPTDNGTYATQSARRAATKTNQTDESKPFKHAEQGRVPQYLLERKAEMAAEEQRRQQSARDKEVPPGMVRMPEEEKRRSLELLHQQLEKLQRQLAAFPLRMETEHRRRAHRELLSRLDEVEAGIKLLQKPIVFIKIA